MFIDELQLTLKAGNGGDGVVRWRHDKFRPMAGPAGGNGGKGGDVYLRAVRDLSLLSKYTGIKEFEAEHGTPGQNSSCHGKNGEDLYIDVPLGATVTDVERERVYTFMQEGETHKVLRGGGGGLGNEYFKSSTNRSPKQSTKGKAGETGLFKIELSLLVDVGLIGYPNAGKSTLLNTLTNATARIGAYPFTTLEPHLGELYGFILADIPGLIEGASEGKGLGHRFLKHVQKTKMLLHCISLEQEDPQKAYTTIRDELRKFDPALMEKEEWIVLTKSDLVSEEAASEFHQKFLHLSDSVFIISAQEEKGIKEFSDALVKHLRSKTEE